MTPRSAAASRSRSMSEAGVDIDGGALAVAAQHRPQRHAADAEPGGQARAPVGAINAEAGHLEQVGQCRILFTLWYSVDANVYYIRLIGEYVNPGRILGRFCHLQPARA
jgi:hypothetical protein